MLCINTSHPEYKDLLEQSGMHPDILKANISMWMDVVSSERFPTLGELTGFKQGVEGKVFDDFFADYDDTLSNQGVIKNGTLYGKSLNWEYSLPSTAAFIFDDVLNRLIEKHKGSITGQDLRKFNALSDVVGEREAWRDYFEQNKNVRPPAKVIEKLQLRYDNSQPDNLDDDVDTELKTIDDLKSLIVSENEALVLDAVEKLSKQLAIPYEFLSVDDAVQQFGVSEKDKAFYAAGKVYFIKGRVNQNTVFHEFSHPFIKAIAKENPELFNALYSDLTSTPEGQAIVEKVLRVENRFDPSSPEFMEEVLVTAMEEFNQVSRTWLNELLFQIKRMLRRLFGKNINISNLSETTTLRDLIDMLNEGSDIKINLELLNEDDIMMFSRMYDKEVEQLNTVAAEETQKLIDEMYTVVQQQLSNFKKDKTAYPIIAELFTTDNYDGEMQIVQKMLDVLSQNSSKPNLPLQLEQDVEVFKNKLNTFIGSFVKATLMFDKFEVGLANIKANVAQRGFQKEDLDALFAVDTYINEWTSFIERVSEVNNGLFRSSTPFGNRVREFSNKLYNLKETSSELRIDATIDVLHEQLMKSHGNMINDYKSQLAHLKQVGNTVAYADMYQEFYGITLEEANELSTLQKRLNDPSAPQIMKVDMERYDELTLRSYSGYNLSKQQLRALITNQLGDSELFNGLIESYKLNQDSVVNGFFEYFDNFMKEVDGNVNSREAKMLNGLKELMSAAGFDNHWVGEVEMGKALAHTTRTVDVQYTVNRDGKEERTLSEIEEYAFISNFKDYEYPLAILKEKLLNAKKEYQFQGTKQTLDAFYDAQEELDDFLNDFFNREYSNDYYQAERILKGSDGRMAKEARDKLFEELRLIQDNYLLDSSNPVLTRDFEMKWFEISQLYNRYDRDGKLKTGDALIIAEKLQEYRKAIQPFFEYEEVPEKFDSALDAFRDKLINDQKILPGTVAFDEAVQNWIRNNTTVQVTEEYFEQRKALLDERKILLEPLMRANNTIGDISPLYEKLYEILKPTKTTEGFFDGTMLSEAEQTELITLHEQIDEIQDTYIKLSGLSNEEQVEFSDLMDVLDYYGSFPNPSDQMRYDQLTEKLEDGLLYFGITEAQIERVKQIDKELRASTQTEPTQVYVNQFLSLIESNADTTQALEEAVRGFFHDVDVDAGEKINGTHINQLLRNYTHVIDKLLSLGNISFEDWFLRNHREHGYVAFENNERVGSATEWLKSAAWQFSSPSDLNFYKTRNYYDQNGNLLGLIELDGIPRIPNMQYMERSVKEEFRTPVITRDVVDENGKLVLATVDNKGKWLPKTVEQGAVDARFIDANYQSLFKTNKPLFNLLQHLKNAHLDHQERLGASDRIYLSYPRFRKTEYEHKTSKGFFRRFWNRTLDNFRRQADDYEIGTFSRSTGLGDPYEFINRPINGSYKLDKNDVSLNIVKSMGNHLYAIETNVALRKSNSVTQMLRRSLQDLSTEPAAKKLLQKYKTLKMNFRFQRDSKDKDKKYNRLTQVERIVERWVDGKQVRYDLGRSTKSFHNIVRRLQRLLSRSSFLLNPISSAKNYFGGKFQMWNLAVDGKIFTAGDLALSRGKSALALKSIIESQYSNAQKPLTVQLIDLMDGIPDRLKKEVGDQGSKTFAQSLFKGEQWYFDRKMLQDSMVLHQFYAILTHNKFEVDGKKVSLDEAIELVNGRIQTKKGTPIDYRITYNSDGEVVLGTQVKRMMDLHQGTLLKTIGQANERTQPEIYRTILGKVSLTMLKFFIPMLMTRTQFSTKRFKAIDVLKGKFHGRYNAYTQRVELGYVLSVIDGLSRFIQSPRFSSLSYRNKVGFMFLAIGVLGKVLLQTFVQGIRFNNDDDDPAMSLSYDPNDEHIYRKLRSATGLPSNLMFVDNRYKPQGGARFDGDDYWKMQLLRLSLGVQNEYNAFEPATAGKTGLTIVTAQSPIVSGPVESLIDISVLVSSDLFGGDADTYDRAAGPLTWQQKDQNKLWNAILKLYGINGKLVDPAYAIERENAGLKN